MGLVNNLGGMGPDLTLPEEIRYKNVATVDGGNVHLVITANDPTTTAAPRQRRWGRPHQQSGPESYKSANWNHREKGRKGQDFVAQYNGNRHRTDVIAIGSLSKGDFSFTFSFVNDDGDAVVMDKLPMTFYDLDGSTGVRGKSYEVVTTQDAVMLEALDGSLVTHSCASDSDNNLICTAKSATVEVDIPINFDELTDATKRAAITFFFENRSSFEITYTLNYAHRVFLFKPQCF